jgi:lipopolysaccharide transport system ATP-binding protein
VPFRRWKKQYPQISQSGFRDQKSGHIWALKDVSFEINHGEVVGIIGRNGAGKSTLLKILSRTTDPTQGYAEIYGRVGSLLEVGTGFHPELTGRENIYLNAAILGMRRREIDRKFDEIVDFAEVEKFLETPVKHYSSGMYVRLAFAVAAHLEPEILLVDEVLAVGDANFQKKCLGKMGEVAKEGRTVLFVSHNMFSLQNLCLKGILLESGQIAMQGGIADVINKYLDSGRKESGEVCWDSPAVAPGDERVRLKAVRVVSEESAKADVDISKELRIEVDYWNLEPGRRRLVSIHLNNSLGVTVLTSANMPSASLTPDPWYSRQYPIGLFRTSCTIPGYLLNDGQHSITVYINEKTAYDNIILARDVLSFAVLDTGGMRKEYMGSIWIGAVRPRLNWNTTQLS